MQAPQADWHSLPDLPLFLQPAYLDAACGAEGWGVAVARDGEGRVRGIWPYERTRRWGLTVLRTPSLTPWLGPWLAPPETPLRATRLVDWQWRTYGDLLDQLPRAAHISIRCPRQLANGMPFQRAGWQQRVRYTYVLRDLRDKEALWAGLRPEVRNKVRKAEGQLELRPAQDIEAYWPLVEASFRHRGARIDFERAAFERLAAWLVGSGAGRLTLAVDAQGRAHAGQLSCRDGRSCYNQLLVSDPALRQSGAAALLLWSSIRQSAEEGCTAFDFAGSHLPGIEGFLRAFGGSPEPYYWLTRQRRWLAAASALRDVLRGGG
jgi:hypothetical protein